MDIVLGIDSIKHPISGIGVYSYSLCKQYLQRSDVRIWGLAPYKLLETQDLKVLLAQVESGYKKAKPVGVKGPFSRKMILRAKDSTLIKSLYHQTSSIAATRHLSKLPTGSIYHVPNFISRGNSEKKKVVTIHDLSHLDCPEMHPDTRVRFMKSRLKKCIDDAEKVIVDSDFTRTRLLDSGLIESGREEDIHRVYLGVEESFTEFKEGFQNVLSGFGLRQKQYIFSIGTIEPRKNHERLIRAYLRLPKKVAEDYPLVICGALGWKYEGLLALLDNVRNPYRVILTGHLKQIDAVILMRHSKCFAYPSLYEGFGMPILEAMSAGVPVITSELGATKEISGQAAHLVDPYSITDISEALLGMLRDGTMESELIKKGRARTAEFSWEKCANETIAVYKSI